MEPLEGNQQYADDADVDNNDTDHADNDEVIGSPSPPNKWNHLRATILKQEILTSSGGDLDLEIFVDLRMFLHTLACFYIPFHTFA